MNSSISTANTNRRQIFGNSITLIQFTADFLTVLMAYLSSFYFYTEIYRGYSPQTFSQFALISAFVSMLYVVIMEQVGLYRREISLLNVKELRGIFKVGIYAAAVVLSVGFYIRFTSFSRITFTIAIIAAPVLLFIERHFFYRLHILFHLKGWSLNRVAIFGTGNIGQLLAKRLFESPSLGMLPVEFFDDDKAKYGQNIRWNGVGPRNGVPITGGEELISQCNNKKIEFVLIALPEATYERNQKLVDLCIKNQIRYAIVPNAYEQFIQQIEMFEIGGIPLFRRKENQKDYIYLAIKRIVDFTLACIFITLLSPLYIIIGIAIKRDSKGPIIFKQKRTGLRGREFSLYKFRSMHLDTPKYAETPHDTNDPRITNVGKWLRRTSFDELPQLFNVFRGDMSLVGPRPEMPFIVQSYTPLEKRRLEVKPGITGVWQISAVRGEPIHANMEYDLFYIENQSILLDLAIILKTVISVIKGEGAI